jgi:hypothetical protein
MWRSGWVLVPASDVPLVTEEANEADVEPWDYPWVGFPDGEIEGTDLNNLWSLVRGSPDAGPLWGPPLWDGPPGSEKIAPVRSSASEAFASLSESRIRELAAAWQRVESETSTLGRWPPEDVAEVIRELRFLARQYQRLRPGWELLMVWWV